MRSGRCREVSASQPALDAYDVARKDAARKTVFGSGCNSWYLDAEGIPNTWPWSQQRLKGAALSAEGRSAVKAGRP